MFARQELRHRLEVLVRNFDDLNPETQIDSVIVDAVFGDVEQVALLERVQQFTSTRARSNWYSLCEWLQQLSEVLLEEEERRRIVAAEAGIPVLPPTTFDSTIAQLSVLKEKAAAVVDELQAEVSPSRWCLDL